MHYEYSNVFANIKNNKGWFLGNGPAKITSKNLK